MPFEKGISGNPKGRPKNTFGYSYKLRHIITNFCEDNAEHFLNEIKRMRTGYAKAQAFTTLLQFCLPKMTESNSTIDVNSIPMNQIDELIKKLIDENE